MNDIETNDALSKLASLSVEDLEEKIQVRLQEVAGLRIFLSAAKARQKTRQRAPATGKRPRRKSLSPEAAPAIVGPSQEELAS